MLLLKDAIMEYLLECKVRRLSQGTIDNYDRQLRYPRFHLRLIDHLLCAAGKRSLLRDVQAAEAL